MKSVFDKYIISRFITIYIISIFSIILYVFVDKDTNLNNLQIYSMYLSPLLLLFFYNNISKIDLLFYVLMVMMLVSALYNKQSFRLSTILYSYMFIFTYLLYSKALKFGRINITFYMKVLKTIILLYTIVLIIQQVSVVLDVPVFNQCWSFSSNKMKLNSLSMEPSNTTLMLPLLMFSYVKMKEMLKGRDYLIVKDFREDKIVWLSFLYVMLTCGSMTAFFSLPVFFLYFVRKRLKPMSILLGAVSIAIVSFVIIKFNDKALLRFSNLLFVVFSLDPSKIGDQDISAAVRFVPYIEFIRSIDIYNLHTWLGHGIDSSERFYTLIIMGADKADRNVGAMNITSLFYDYGYIAGILFIVILKRAIASKYFSYEILFYVLLFSVLTINHYVLWLFLILMSTNYYFETKYKSFLISQQKRLLIVDNK